MDLIHNHIRNIFMTQGGNHPCKMNSILSKRMRHGNWFPCLPRGSLCNVSGYFKKIVEDRSDVKYKDILFSNGFSQFRVDYTETFAPVAKMDSIRLVLAIATSKC